MSWDRDLTKLFLAAWDESKRQAARRKREIERREKWQAKTRVLEAAALEVQEYEEYISRLLSIHQKSSECRSWESIQRCAPPTIPLRVDLLESQARQSLDNYRPSLFDTLFRRADSKRSRLSLAVDSARRADDESHERELAAFEEAYAKWKTRREQATRVLDREERAWLQVIEEANPFAEINEFGGSVELFIRDGQPDATVTVGSDGVIPTEGKALLMSGKLSVKKTSQSRFFDLYQSYVCGCVIRVTREVFALLPITTVVVTAIGTVRNKNLETELCPVISASISRKRLEEVLSLYPDSPDICIMSLSPRMNFRKTKGFRAVDPIRSGE